MSSALPILGTIFFVFLLAKTLGYGGQRLGLPMLVGEVIAGIVIANFAFGGFTLYDFLQLNPATSSGSANYQTLSAMAQLGLTFLVFTVGLRVRPNDVREVGRPALRLALIGTAVPFAMGVGLVVLFEGPGSLYASLLIGTALAATSVPVIAYLLQTHGMVNTPTGRLVIAGAVFEDILAFVLITFLLAVDVSSSTWTVDLAYQLGIVLGFAIGFVLLIVFVSDGVLRRLHRSSPEPGRLRRDRIGMFVIAVLVCLGASVLTEQFQLAGIVGAFFAGMVMSEVNEAYELERSFSTVNAFLVPFFFVWIGGQISGGDLIAAWPLAVIVTLIAIGSKLGASALDSHTEGARVILTNGTAFVARGETAMIIAFAAWSAGAIDYDYYTALIVMAIATTLIGPWLFHYVQQHWPSSGGPTEGSVPTKL